MAQLILREVRKSFGNLEILKGVSLEVDDGSFVALVGPSGCGKSTLLRMIAGLERVSSGEIEIAGRVVNHLSPRARNIAMVFQSYALYPHLNVARNMSFALELQGMPRAAIDAEVKRAAEVLGLTPLLERLPRELSGGQRQRVAMGRAIVRNPDLFLFDEPLSNLDANLRVHMRSEIKELHQRLGKTTIYVTHDQVEAMTMADKIVVMRAGEIEQMGAPLDLYDRPANIFVAGFLGSPAMNFIPAVVEGDGRRVRVGEHSFALAGRVPCADGTAVTLGIRPECLVPAETGAELAVNLVEPTGSETLVQAALGAVKVQMLVRERLNLQPGDRVAVAVAARHIHVFSPENGQRLVLGE